MMLCLKIENQVTLFLQMILVDQTSSPVLTTSTVFQMMNCVTTVKIVLIVLMKLQAIVTPINTGVILRHCVMSGNKTVMTSSHGRESGGALIA